MGVVVDSNVLIDLLAGNARAVAKVREAERAFGPPFISSVVLFETLVGVLFRGSATKAQALEALLTRYPSLPVDATDARRAAEIRVELLRSGRAASTADALIAGQALQGGHLLITRDQALLKAASAVGFRAETY